MRGATLFSGIGAPELAAPQVNWRWCAEIDPFASAVLAARFPCTKNLGDVTRITSDAVEPVDVIVFGSPCQSFSVAGKRAGLDDPRGNMALVGLQIVDRVRPDWLVFENVPGLLSSDEWRDFGTFLGALGECGYGFAYRILDAQYAGVPQRRRRVFVVGHIGDWRPPAAVLFEPESLCGHPAPRTEATEGITPILEVGARTGISTDDPRAGIGVGEPGDPMFTLQSGKHHGITGPMAVNAGIERENGFAIPIQGSLDRQKRQNGMGLGEAGGPQFTLTGRDQHAVAFTAKDHGQDAGNQTAPTLCGMVGEHANAGGQVAVAFQTRIARNGRGQPSEFAPALNGTNAGETSDSRPLIATSMAVRRLTPRECERLQGFPDDWTAIGYNGKPAADGPRYRALGNAMAVPVIGWILGRICEFEGLN